MKTLLLVTGSFRDSNYVQLYGLAQSSEFSYRAFKDVLGDLKKNQFIQKPIGNDELTKIVNEITSST
jgi:hypothetical protein